MSISNKRCTTASSSGLHAFECSMYPWFSSDKRKRRYICRWFYVAQDVPVKPGLHTHVPSTQEPRPLQLSWHLSSFLTSAAVSLADASPGASIDLARMLQTSRKAIRVASTSLKSPVAIMSLTHALRYGVESTSSRHSGGWSTSTQTFLASESVISIGCQILITSNYCLTDLHCDSMQSFHVFDANTLFGWWHQSDGHRFFKRRTSIRHARRFDGISWLTIIQI